MSMLYIQHLCIILKIQGQIYQKSSYISLIQKQMFTLADDIKKFEELTLNLPDNVITIDERFLGGGIKMHDLVQQNSFIITQMRKFKNVFLNYCQLNDKVYKKIIQHQVNSNQHLNKMAALTSVIDRKIQVSDQQNKKNKQQLLMNMANLRDITQSSAKKVREGWDGKVNQSNFNERVKKIIDQYQQQNMSVPSNDNQKHDGNSINISSNNPNNINSTGSKRKRGLTLQDIQALKAQITPMIDQAKENINKQKLRVDECFGRLQNKATKITKVQQSTNWLTQDLTTLRQQISQIKVHVNKQDQKIMQYIRQNINENVWTRRFEHFNQGVLVPSIEKVNQTIYKGLQYIKKDIDEGVKPKFIQINVQLQKMREKQKSIQAKIAKNQQKFPMILKNIQQVREQLKSKIVESNKKYEKILYQESNTNRKQIERLQLSILSNTNSIDNIIVGAEQAVLKKVEQKLGKQMNNIKEDISSLNRKTSDINSSIKYNKEQVTYVKDVVAKKANYTDLVMYFDKKADKEDFKELQQKIADCSPKQQNKSKIHFDGFMDQSNYKTNDQIHRRRKHSFTKRNTTPIAKPEQQTGRYIYLGWQASEKGSKQILFSSINKPNSASKGSNQKRKQIRPSTANTFVRI